MYFPYGFPSWMQPWSGWREVEWGAATWPNSSVWLAAEDSATMGFVFNPTSKFGLDWKLVLLGNGQWFCQ